VAIGCPLFGALSQRIGRRTTIVLAALLSLHHHRRGCVGQWHLSWHPDCFTDIAQLSNRNRRCHMNEAEPAISYQDKAGCDESITKAKAWIQEHGSKIGAGAPKISEGAVLLQLK
jgi:hypothetical protein